MKRLFYIFLFVFSLAATDVYAQEDKRELRRGNRDFKKEDYKEAELDYFRALVKDSLSFAANYNMANTLYRQGSFQQAREYLDKLKDVAVASPAAADYYYNLGNVAVAMEDYQTAVDSYKQSLLRNPGDLQAKENYIYAKEKLKQQQDQDKEQDKDKDQKQDQDKDQNKDENQDKNQDQDKDQQNDQQNDEQKQERDQEQDQDQEQNQGQQKISPQAAQQMLQAIQAKEKETQDKVNKEKAAALKSRQKEKNW